MASRAQQRRHSGACLEDDRPPAATPHGSERDVVLDTFAEFVTEETLPPRPPRKSPDDAALDAFELEASAFAAPSIPTGTSTAGASRPPAAAGDRRAFVLPAWRSVAAAAGIATIVIIVGLLAKPSGTPPSPSPPDAARSPVLATASAIGPRDLAVTPASTQATLPAPAVDAAAEPERPSAAAPPPAQGEPAGPAATARPAPPAVDPAPPAVNEDATAAPSATTGNVMATNAVPTIDPGIDAVLPAARPAPEIPSVNLTPRPDAGDSTPPSPPARPAPPSAEDQVGAVLGQFQAAYSRLDAGSVQAIWPSVDLTRLDRAFRNLDWQDLEFTECRLDVAGATATATCTGVVEYATRVGNRQSREARRWTFALRKASEGWLIQDVLMR